MAELAGWSCLQAQFATVTEAAQPQQPSQPATLTCGKCGSTRLSRSRTRGARERLLKWFSDARPWRCDNCEERMISTMRPANREPMSFRPNPGPDPKPAPSPEPHPAPSPVPDPNPRRTGKRHDLLGERLKTRRMKRHLITAALVVLAGLAGAALVTRTSGPSSAVEAE